MLERFKLYLAVPYGVFTPSDGESTVGGDAPGRYPALYAAPSERVENVAVMLSALRLDLFDVAEAPLRGQALLDAWFEALREAEPLVFGSLGADQAETALDRFDINATDLEAASGWLLQTQRASGTPWACRQSVGSERRICGALGHLSAPPLNGMAAALTEARANLDEWDARDYAVRGLAHAREYARRVADLAYEQRAGDEAGKLALSALRDDRSLARTRFCLEPEGRATLRVLGWNVDAAEAQERYAVFRGEARTACALTGEIFGAPCTPPEPVASAYNAQENALEFVVQGHVSQGDQLYLTERVSETGTTHRRVVAAFSLKPFTAPETRRCATVPLDATLHERLSVLHRESVGATVPRVPEQPRGALPYTLASDSPVPLAWGRTLEVTGGTHGRVRVDLAQAFDSATQELVTSVMAACTLAPLVGQGPDGMLCDYTELASVREALCLAEALGQEGPSLGAYVVTPVSAEQIWSRKLWAQQARQAAVIRLAQALDGFACEALDSSAASDTPLLEDRLWSLAGEAARDLWAHYLELRSDFEARIVQRWRTEPDERKAALGSVRALHDSRLAAARLLVAVPHSLYGDGGELPELLDGALTRFPVVAQSAQLAEDARIEELLRTSGVHPLLPDLTLDAGTFSLPEYRTLLSNGTLASRLRARLVSLDPATYGGMASNPGAFLQALGVTSGQLENAAVRLVQLSEARGLSLLPLRETEPLQSHGLKANYPASHGHHLYALTEGRMAVSGSAHPTSVAARGVFHALGYLEAAMRRRLSRGQAEAGWYDIHASVAEHALGIDSTFHVTQGHADFALDVIIAEASDLPSQDALEEYELWWTDSGLACALHGTLDGSPCDEHEFRLVPGSLSSEPAEDPSQGVIAHLANMGLPVPNSWDPALSIERTQGRVYLTKRQDDVRVALAGIQLGPFDANGHRVVPRAPELYAHLRDLLAYQSPGEACAGCVPRSVCEETACVLGWCIREPLDGISCAATGVCEAGQCDQPGCGDGARSTGEDGIPYEACDDGNLEDGDGCSGECTVETRALEPLIQEGWPAGPAPAVGVDGLGRTLIVYTADDLSGEAVRVRAARFDAFGVRQGSELTLASDLPRGYRAEPTVAGLPSEGFVVLYANPDQDGESALAFRLIDAVGAVSSSRAIDANGAVQSGGRVAAVDGGFVVTWTERTGVGSPDRVRVRAFDELGDPQGSSVWVSSAGANVAQAEPSLASSLGQVLVAWVERSTGDGRSLGVRARRFSGLGSAVDATAFELAPANADQPSVGVLGTGDFVVAWTSRARDLLGDIDARDVRRFGPPLSSSAVRRVAQSTEAEQRPVIAGAEGSSFVLAYQRGAPFGYTELVAPGIHHSSVETARSALTLSTLADVSAVRAPRGIWLVWSQRLVQRRALYAITLPLESNGP